MVRWIINHPDHLKSVFNDDCGRACFMAGDQAFLHESAGAARAAGFAVTMDANGWKTLEPSWPVLKDNKSLSEK